MLFAVYACLASMVYGALLNNFKTEFEFI